MKFQSALTFLTILVFNANAQNYFSLKGKIVDAVSNQPIEGAYVSFASKSQGIISNENGDFVLKFPKNHLDTSLVINAFGYTPRIDAIEQTDSLYTFSLERAIPQRLDKLKFDSLNIKSKVLVNLAFSEIRKLYPIKPSLLTGYYQEMASVNSEDAVLKEAIIRVERTTGLRNELGDKVKLMKGRTLENPINANIIRKHGFKNGFNIAVKSFESGVPEFFGDDLSDYAFKLDTNLIEINNRYNYVFSFSPIKKRIKAERTGSLYVDTLTNAIVRMEYEMTEKGADDVFAGNVLSNIKKTGKSITYAINYKLFSGKWYLQDSKLKIETELENMLNANQKVSNELNIRFVTTDIGKSNGRFIDSLDRMVDTDEIKKSNKTSDNFWQNYNFVPQPKIKAFEGYNNLKSYAIGK